jgi:NADH dehydrogenase
VTIPGDGMAKFQPLFIDDWVKCFLAIIGSETSKGMTYELGGPEQLTYNQIISQFMEAAGTRKPVIHVPMSLMKASLPFMGFARGLGMIVGKKIPSVTAEQLALLESDNICDANEVEKAFGFTPIPYKEALKKFLR